MCSDSLLREVRNWWRKLLDSKTSHDPLCGHWGQMQAVDISQFWSLGPGEND